MEELYGDSKDETWKQKEIARLKAEQGIQDLEEPGVSLDAGNFQVRGFQGGVPDEGQSGKKNVPDELEGVPGASGSSKGSGA